MVSNGVSYPCNTATDCAAMKAGVVDGVANATSLQGALSQIGVPSSVPIDTPGIRSQLISVLSNPNVSGLLFLVGVFAVLFDVYHPTLVLSVVGVVVIALAFFGLGVFGANPLSIFLMVVGAAFIFLEVKTQHGISALVGVVIFIVGFLFIFQYPPASNPSLPAVNFSPIPDLTYGLLVALAASIVLGSLYLRRIRQGLMMKPKVFDSSGTVGKKGTMKSDLKPGGKGVALIGAEDWSVTSEQELKRGDPITVKAVDGLELVVEKQQ
jgi:membrane-bound serine protease (ClpP class)